MWKEDLLTPASAVRHVAVDNMNFVMLLRKEENDSKVAKLPSSPLVTKRPPSAKPNVNPSKELLEDPSVRAILKETGCRNSKCLQADAELIENLSEVSIYFPFPLVSVCQIGFILSRNNTYKIR